jgi:signal transduction histidine kinase
MTPSPVRALSEPALSLALWMIVAIVAVAGLAYWDEQRESTAAFEDFAREQSTLAKSVSAGLAVRLTAIENEARARGRDGGDVYDRDGHVVVHVRAADALPMSAPEDGQTFRLGIPLDERTRVDVLAHTAALLEGIADVEEAGSVIVLMKRPQRRGLVTRDGRVVNARAIESSFDAMTSWLRLTRKEAAGLGLPSRTAIAGLSSVDAGAMGKWGIAVVASAQRERDRELRAQWRLVLGLVLASGLVLAFGGVALRKQRKGLELSRELAIAEVEQERDEKLVRADKLATMGALATGIAHEVSTPLGIIMGRAEQLAPKLEADARAMRSLQAITEQTERIRQIIAGFLNLARGESPRLERVQPADVARRAVDLVQHRFTKAGVTLRMTAAPTLPFIECEPMLFEQVIVNLLLNACDACSTGGHVTLDVTANDARIAFVVTDDGAGILPEDAVRATDPFFTTKPLGKGTGLGLAIANEIVKNHNGKLSIAPRGGAQSSGPRGTRVSVDLPAWVEVTS